MFSASMEKAYIGKTGRFAVVISEATRKDLEFLEKTTQKRGMKVQTFMSVDEAIDWFEKAYEARSDCWIWGNIDPRLDELRKDPRFRDLLRRVGHHVMEE